MWSSLEAGPLVDVSWLMIASSLRGTSASSVPEAIGDERRGVVSEGLDAFPFVLGGVPMMAGCEERRLVTGNFFNCMILVMEAMT